jgi:hypothetical protein
MRIVTLILHNPLCMGRQRPHGARRPLETGMEGSRRREGSEQS